MSDLVLIFLSNNHIIVITFQVTQVPLFSAKLNSRRGGGNFCSRLNLSSRDVIVRI